MSTEPTLLHRKLVEAMLALGCCEIHGGSRVWRVFSHDRIVGKKFFVNSGGALRAGTSINDSSPAYLEKARLLQAWEQFQPAIILGKVENL